MRRSRRLAESTRGIDGQGGADEASDRDVRCARAEPAEDARGVGGDRQPFSRKAPVCRGAVPLSAGTRVVRVDQFPFPEQTESLAIPTDQYWQRN